MKGVCYIILLLLIGFNPFQNIYAQEVSQLKLDSLLLEFNTTNSNEQQANILIEAAKVASQLKLYSESMDYAQRALSIAEGSELKKAKIEAMIEMAGVSRLINDNKRAFEYASEAKALAEVNSFSLQYAYASLLLSKIFFVIGEYDQSIQLAYSTLSEFEKEGDYKELCDALNMIGITYIENDKDSLAEKYLTRAINISKGHKLYGELGTTIGNLATLYGKSNKVNEAINLQKKGCEILRNNTKEASSIGIGYYNIGHGYLILEQPDSAYVYLKKAEVVSLKANNFRNLTAVHMGLAKYFKFINNDARFLNQIYLANDISSNNDFKQFQLIVAQFLEEYYIEHNNIDSAYKYKKIQFELNIKINSQNVSTKLAQFEIIKELELAEKERAFKQHKKTLYIIILLVTLVSLLVLFLVLMLRYKIKVRYSRLKQEKLKDEIYFKNKESTIRLMELMKKNELLSDITVELVKVSRGMQNKEKKSTINKIALKIKNITKEEIWEEFSVRFQQVHGEFYKNLSENFPDLTSNEQRLCAFLKLNLSTKEISSITGQSERAIVMARHRLRKKMGLDSQDVNLISFISKI